MSILPRPQSPVTVRMFTQRLTSVPRNARLARRLTRHRLHAWGIPYGSEVSDAAALLVAELAANAISHGRVPGRYFEVGVELLEGTLRIEVSDARGECRPPDPDKVVTPGPDEESGRGLCLVDALASRWSVLDRSPIGKTVRAELDLDNP